MTVRELVEFLETMPQDAPVLYRCYSDYTELEADEIELSVPTEKDGVVKHHGHWMLSRSDWWDEKSKTAKPETLTVLLFPGN